jgi:hypothetical protein
MTSKLWRTAASVAIAMALAAAIPHVARAASQDKAAAPAVSQVTASPAGGLTVSIDPRTGRIRPISPEEAKQLVAGMSKMFARTITAEAVTQHSNGMVSVNLAGSFLNVYLARINADGSVGQACVDNADAAVAFFQGADAAWEEQ